MKQLKDEDDLVLLEEFRKSNHISEWLHILVAVELLVWCFLWHFSKILFWINLIIILLVGIGNMDGIQKEKNVKRELKKRKLII